ncbi:unnamed protein product [Mytilus edulis]|uniref:Ig-like domain-containing protein n=1 Tax=Mytilus edulis TaxID=6550 RepID=A0A8S3SXU9_MYTED|nr:unnamed protein product [Mytilus edulis]
MLIFHITVGPGSSLKFEPSAISLTRTNGEQLGPINCAATCNPPCQYTWIKPNTATIDGGQIGFGVKPFLDQTRPYSPPYVSAAENISLHLQLTVNANPTPTIEWKFRTQADWDSCNFITIVSNTTTNGFFTSSSVLIDDEQSDIFGEYTFSANNTVGTFFRRFVVMKEANLAQVKCPISNENTGMFLAGIVTLIVGLMSLTTAVTFCCQERINNYEECGRSSEAHSYSSVDKKEAGEKIALKGPPNLVHQH